MAAYNLPPDLARAITDLSNRIAALERTRTIPTGSGAPTTAPADGAQYGDETNLKLYVRLGGAWKSVTVA